MGGSGHGKNCNAVETITLENSANAAHCLVDSKVINAKFVSYNNWAPPPICLPSHDC